MSKSKTIVAGVGMIKFSKPGASENYDVMGEQAIRQALENRGLDYSHVQQAYAGHVYGDSTCGQKVGRRRDSLAAGDSFQAR